MTATGEAQVAFMKRTGMPETTKTRITYTEVVRHARLAYVNHVDFVQGKEPYEAPMTVDFEPAPNGVRLVLTLDPMHDQEWTGRMVAGWENQLGKLEKVIADRATR